jgi:hypothetical protein
MSDFPFSIKRLIAFPHRAAAPQTPPPSGYFF